MGVDLLPWDPDESAPKPDGCIWLYFTDKEWINFSAAMEPLGVDLQGFPGSNTTPLPVLEEETCLAIAEALENNAQSLSAEDKEHWIAQIPLWTNAGGFMAF